MEPATLLRPHLRDLGGLVVRRLLPAHPTRNVGPFVFFDHFGPVDFAPGEGIDVRPHPHIGLATVTYLFAGALMHRDSLGTVQRIEPGDVNWMTAGRGIVHSERTDAPERVRGGPVHGLQTWVALPAADAESPPGFTHVPAARLPRFAETGVRGVVVAGHGFGHTAPVRTFSDTLYVALELDAGARLRVPDEHAERAVYVVSGDVLIDDMPVPEHHLAVLAPGARPTLSVRTAARVMLVGGAPLDGERIIWWNFVAASRERVERAKDDWRAQRFGRVPGETEFIPLPDAPTVAQPPPPGPPGAL
ncbi:MAG TPA: pirin family protein [Casimicrobiaceae bacterium]|nr:pirin family protein [Casimicrobiaceae bacterium]